MVWRLCRDITETICSAKSGNRQRLLPTLAQQSDWQDIVRPDAPQHFYAVFDATLDLMAMGSQITASITSPAPTQPRLIVTTKMATGCTIGTRSSFGNLDQDGSMDLMAMG